MSDWDWETNAASADWRRRGYAGPEQLFEIWREDKSQSLISLFAAFNGTQDAQDAIERAARGGCRDALAASRLSRELGVETRKIWSPISADDYRRLKDILDNDQQALFRGEALSAYPYYTPGNILGYDIGWVRETLDDARRQLPLFAAARTSDVAVLVGNGPSLNQTDLALLNGHDVFITNYAVKHPILSKIAKGVAVTNYLVAEQEPYLFTLKRNVWKVFPFWLRNTIYPDDKTIFLNAMGGDLFFSENVAEKVGWHATVTFFWLQTLYHLGYRKVLMIGFDHSYSQAKNLNEGDLIKQEDDDPNHFDPTYFKGKTWQAADVNHMEATYALSREVYETDGREIVNCTVGGKLEVFPRADLKVELAPEPASVRPVKSSRAPRIAIVTPFWQGDVDAAERHWRIINRLGQPSADHIHLFKHGREQLPANTMPHVVCADIDRNYPERSEAAHPAGPNLTFVSAVQLLAKSDYTHFFWLEPDCMPTEADWLEPFREAAEAHPDAPIVGVGGGTVVPDTPHWKHHFAGCSLYNIDALSKIDWASFVEKHLDISFDVWLSVTLGYIELLDVDNDDQQDTIIFGADRYKWRLLKKPDAVVTGMFEHWRPQKFLSTEQLRERIDSGDFSLFHAIKDEALQRHIYESIQPSVSTIIINYNNGAFLREAIDSALAQSEIDHVNYEVIVADDGSTDESRDIIGSYSGRIRPVLLEHGKLSGNYNQQRALLAGVAAAKGDIIALLDGDDTCFPLKIRKFVDAFSDPAVVMAQHSLEQIGENGQRLGDTKSFMANAPRTAAAFRNAKRANFFQPTSGLAFRRSYLNAAKRFLGPDVFHRTWLDVRLTRLAHAFGEIVSILDDLGGWRRHDASDSIARDNLRVRLVEHHDWLEANRRPLGSKIRFRGSAQERKLAAEDPFAMLHAAGVRLSYARGGAITAAVNNDAPADVTNACRGRMAVILPDDAPLGEIDWAMLSRFDLFLSAAVAGDVIFRIQEFLRHAPPDSPGAGFQAGYIFVCGDKATTPSDIGAGLIGRKVLPLNTGATLQEAAHMLGYLCFDSPNAVQEALWTPDELARDDDAQRFQRQESVNGRIFNGYGLAEDAHANEVAWRRVLDETPPDPSDLPRVLLIDPTQIGDATATGDLKAALFAHWPEDKIFQIANAGPGRIRTRFNGRAKTHRIGAGAYPRKVRARIAEFKPNLILYRPAPRVGAAQLAAVAPRFFGVIPRRNDATVFHRAAMSFISKSKTPLAAWIVDDWPSALEMENSIAFARFNKDWRALLSRSKVRFSISDAMSEAFEARYGVDFTAISNGVDPADWPRAGLPSDGGPLTVRYAGSLAENMTLETVVLIAEAVEQLANEGVDIRFEIKTRELWRDVAGARFEAFSKTSLITTDLSADAYRQWLSEADVVVIGYNFDDASLTYTAYSLANKLPECLACGAALLAVGPLETATMARLQALDCGARVTKNDVTAIAQTLRALASSAEHRYDLARKAQTVAFERFNIFDARARFAAALATASGVTRPSPATGYPRSAHAHIDETAVVARLLNARKGSGHVMLDVGAHVGTSAAYFDKLGWAIYCFEPDAKNRSKLEERFKQSNRITIDPRAVSNEAATGASFFTSEESTGISGLHAFRESHAESAQVDITTIADVVEKQKIKHVDFLKIDVEGFDLSVLKGVPWDRCTPDVIECEFEDAKTLSLGHTWRDIADYLSARDYSVYVCEWHPIVRYGVRHDFRRVFPYGEDDVKPTAWGNLLAFRKDPGPKPVQSAFEALITAEVKPGGRTNAARTISGATKSAPPAPGEAKPRLINASIDKAIARRSPRLFDALVLAKGALRGLWRRRRWTVPAFLALGAFALAAFLPPFAPFRIAMIGAAAFAVSVLLTLYVGLRSYQNLRALSAEVSRLGGAQTTRTASVDKRLKALTNRLQSADATLSSVRSTINANRDNFAKEFGAVWQNVESLSATLDEKLHAVRDLVAAEIASQSAILGEVKQTLDDAIDENNKLAEENLGVALRLQSAAQGDAKDLQDQYAKLLAEKERQDALLRKVSEKLVTASEQLQRLSGDEQTHKAAAILNDGSPTNGALEEGDAQTRETGQSETARREGRER
ncbi:MAG: FkbM family methyltransferase [Pseudomonadota bacterium]